jgi:hypothetical protein
VLDPHAVAEDGVVDVADGVDVWVAGLDRGAVAEPGADGAAVLVVMASMRTPSRRSTPLA